jgi:membrane glycosyltransferase
MTFPWVWNPVLLSALTAPMSVLFACLAVVCGYFGRRRMQMKVHVN